MVCQPAVQRIIELLRGRLDLLAGKFGQLAWLVHARDHRLDDAAPARSHGIAEHRVEPDVRLCQRLLNTLRMPRLLAHQLLTGAREGVRNDM